MKDCSNKDGKHRRNKIATQMGFSRNLQMQQKERRENICPSLIALCSMHGDNTSKICRTWHGEEKRKINIQDRTT